METRLRSRKASEIKPLPGERQGTSGAAAGSDSMRVGSGRMLNRRAPTGSPEYNTAEVINSSQETSHRATTAEPVSQGGNPILPETTLAGKRRVRMKWSQDINIFLMRTYYKLTRLETDKAAYRDKMYQAFVENYPTIPVTAQRIADQRRSIVNNKLLSNDILDRIKREVASEQEASPGQELNRQERSPCISINDASTEQMNDQEDLENSGTKDPDKKGDNECVTHLDDMFRAAMQEYMGTDPTKRPRIPRQKSSRKFARNVELLNKHVIPRYLNVEDFSELHNIIYCAAITAARCNGAKIVDPNKSTDGHRRETVPKWKRRLSKKIETKRTEIARLLEFRKGKPSKKLRRKATAILKNNKIHTERDGPNQDVTGVIDTLKQKLAAWSARLKRYSQCDRRKQQNKQFANNEKQFYRELKAKPRHKKDGADCTDTPSRDDITEFWAGIWSNTKEYNKEAKWIKEEEEAASTITDMQEPVITAEILKKVIDNTHNWKSPGSDKLHNFWYKKFTNVHDKLLGFINDFLINPETVPKFLMQGKTYLLPKGELTKDPSNYRPITCLQTIYKIITACITHILNLHVETQNIMTEEQKGCRKGSKGCKEQLIIDSVILNQASKKNRKLFCCYIDYQKAYDSVPHTWLIRALEIYKVHPTVVKFLGHLMQSWRTEIYLMTDEQTITTPEIRIKRGIFQGDALSPLWFCLALNPLSSVLKRQGNGYCLKSEETEYIVSHLLYMDDIKLFAPTQNLLKGLIREVELFSSDINMTFGLDKCKIINISRNRGRCEAIEYETNQGENMGVIEEGYFYKYLGFYQEKKIDHTNVKNSLTKDYLARVRMLCQTDLNSKHLFKAINSFAVPVLTYSFGIISWSRTDLDNIMRQTRVELTKFRKHHPKASTLRLTLPRAEGGRGLIDIQNLHNSQVQKLRDYFHLKTQVSTLHRSVSQADLKLTPLNLSSLEPPPNNVDSNTHSRQEKHNSWRSMALHGRHPHDLDQIYVDKEASNAWLRYGDLFPETEGFFIAIQDQVVNTKNYRKHIIKDPSVRDDRCRKCNEKAETIQHIMSACSTLSQSEYLHRHDQIAAIIHQEIAINLKLLKDRTPYYKYKATPVVDSSKVSLYFDRSIITDRCIPNNRPDIVLRDKELKIAYLIDIAVPNTHNIQNTMAEKKRKYNDLSDEIEKMWQLRKVYIVPIVLSTTGVIPKALHEGLKILGIRREVYILLQKAAILNTTRIVRKFLSHD